MSSNVLSWRLISSNPFWTDANRTISPLPSLRTRFLLAGPSNVASLGSLHPHRDRFQKIPCYFAQTMISFPDLSLICFAPFRTSSSSLLTEMCSLENASAIFEKAKCANFPVFSLLAGKFRRRKFSARLRAPPDSCNSSHLLRTSYFAEAILFCCFRGFLVSSRCPERLVHSVCYGSQSLTMPARQRAEKLLQNPAKHHFKPRSGHLSEHRSQVAAEDDEIFYVDPTVRFQSSDPTATRA
jgi:hypothetical protein